MLVVGRLGDASASDVAAVGLLAEGDANVRLLVDVERERRSDRDLLREASRAWGAVLAPDRRRLPHGRDQRRRGGMAAPGGPPRWPSAGRWRSDAVRGGLCGGDAVRIGGGGGERVLAKGGRVDRGAISDGAGAAGDRRGCGWGARVGGGDGLALAEGGAVRRRAQGDRRRWPENVRHTLQGLGSNRVEGSADGDRRARGRDAGAEHISGGAV